ncbi:MAG: hypothetical protein ACRD03_15975 [Acidimicrobiales bacterium]
MYSLPETGGALIAACYKDIAVNIPLDDPHSYRETHFMHVPAHAVHREGNPSNRVADLVVFRVGSGDIVVNVDGPELE